MATIRILPDLLANKIAAGEVVERPASVVKELVENALDAGGTRIHVDIEKGGRSLIRVTDNGSGMSHDDALLCLERFATSKLNDENGLSAIATLGFRGEALPSIAAVSRMILTSRRNDEETGVEVNVQGGKIQDVRETGAPVGTMIKVSDLFYNTPARRKFLKGVSTEMSHIGDTIAGLALGNPEVHFKLTHNAKTVHQWARCDEPALRAAQILGRSAGDDLIPLEIRQRNLAITGYLSHPRATRTTSRGTFIFVNGRRVRDRVIQHALMEGYHGRILKGRFPLAVLFLRLPFDRVDVNVHPTKNEVRFLDSREVHAAVSNGVAAALRHHERSFWAAVPSEKDPPGLSAEPIPAYLTRPKPTHTETTTRSAGKSEAWTVHDRTRNIWDIAANRAFSPEEGHAALGSDSSVEHRIPRFADLDIIGQFSATYIICAMDNDLILIDQHAAHERIVFEELGRSSGNIPSQRLLLPATVELGFAETQALKELLPELALIGLEIEPFGGTTFAVRSVPDILDPGGIEDIVVEIAEKRLEMAPDENPGRFLERCRMVIACHRSIRANQRLTEAEIRALLSRLDLCRDPGHCPHGRPIWIHWSVRDLAKTFGRMG